MPTSLLGEQVESPVNGLAAGAIGANLFVKPSTTGPPGSYEVCDAAGEAVAGISLYSAADGESFAFAAAGGDVARVTAGAAFGQGVKLATDVAGKAQLATTGQVVAGVSQEAASGADVLAHAQITASSGEAAP